MNRKKKKSCKFRGRRYGRGNTKNGRGSGNRGGVGRAGSFMHKFSQMLKYYPEMLSPPGFHCPTTRKVKEINVFEINNMAKKGEIQQKDGKYSFEFDGKILGDGEISVPVLVKAKAASKSAIEKIRKAGGDVLLPEKKEEAPKEETKKPEGAKAHAHAQKPAQQGQKKDAA